MEITEITVHLGGTWPTFQYANTRPGVSYRATVSPDEDVNSVRDHLITRASLDLEIMVDLARAMEGLEAHFCTDKQTLLLVPQEEFLAIIPEEWIEDLSPVWRKYVVTVTCRPDHLSLYLFRKYGYKVKLFSDKNDLPPLDEYRFLIADNVQYSDEKVILVIGPAVQGALPDDSGWNERWVKGKKETLFESSLREFIARKEEEGYRVAVCLTNDGIQTIPNLTSQEALVPASPDVAYGIDDNEDEF